MKHECFVEYSQVNQLQDEQGEMNMKRKRKESREDETGRMSRHRWSNGHRIKVYWTSPWLLRWYFRVERTCAWKQEEKETQRPSSVFWQRLYSMYSVIQSICASRPGRPRHLVSVNLRRKHLHLVHFRHLFSSLYASHLSKCESESNCCINLATFSPAFNGKMKKDIFLLGLCRENKILVRESEEKRKIDYISILTINSPVKHVKPSLFPFPFVDVSLT